jgi:hypothetical protein
VDTVSASTTWTGPDGDVFALYRKSTPNWGADPIDPELVVLQEIDDNEEETGRVAGLEIVGFLDFDRWDEIPTFPMLWQLPGWEPLPVVELLRRKQRQLREAVEAAAARPPART